MKYKALVFLFLLFFTSIQSLAAIVKIPIAPSGNAPYNELVCNEQDKGRIAQLIKFIAENNYATLLWREEHLRNLGAQINAVHPLKFLSYALSDVKDPLRQIFADTLKKDGFMIGKDGLAVNLEREARKGTLDKYIGPFAEDIGVPKEKIQPYFKSRDWEGLVSFLISR